MRTIAMASDIQLAQLLHTKETILYTSETPHPYRIQWMTIGDMPKEGYPVLYLLDGDMTFPVASVAAHTFMVNKVAKKNAPVMIVGIGYGREELLDLKKRALDYTPPTRDNRADIDYGGADKFTLFISNDLLPFLAKQTKINIKEQAIFGHSFGGLFASYNLLGKSNLFKYAVISSPSLWWDDKRVFDFFSSQMLSDRHIRLSLGELEIPKETADTRRQQRDMWGNLEKFAHYLGNQGVTVQLERYEGENHGTVMYRALLDGMKFLQPYWQKEQ